MRKMMAVMYGLFALCAMWWHCLLGGTVLGLWAGCLLLILSRSKRVLLIFNSCLFLLLVFCFYSDFPLFFLLGTEYFSLFYFLSIALVIGCICFLVFNKEKIIFSDFIEKKRNMIAAFGIVVFLFSSFFLDFIARSLYLKPPSITDYSIQEKRINFSLIESAKSNNEYYLSAKPAVKLFYSKNYLSDMYISIYDSKGRYLMNSAYPVYSDLQKEIIYGLFECGDRRIYFRMGTTTKDNWEFLKRTAFSMKYSVTELFDTRTLIIRLPFSLQELEIKDKSIGDGM